MTSRATFECIKDYFKEPLEEISKWFNIVKEELEIQAKIKE